MQARRRMALLTMILTALVLLAGCGDAGIAPSATASGAAGGTTAPTAQPAANYPPTVPAGAQVNIVFENYNLATAGLGKDATQQLIDEFNAAHPNIKVEGRGTVSTEITAKVQAETAAGNPPDLVQGLFNDFDFIINGLQAQAVEDLVPPAELAAWRGGPFPISPNGLKLGSYNGKTYGVPYTISTPTLFYNADLFTAAGLDPDKPPTTWAEVKQDALAIKQRTGKEGVHACDFSIDWTLQALTRSSGGRMLSEDRKTLTFAQPEAVDAFKMCQDLVQSGAHPTLHGADISAAFQGGNLAMMLTTSASQVSFLAAAKGKFTLRTAKMPAFAGKPVIPVNSGSGLFILSKDPLKQRAAWELMNFLTSEHSYTIITSKIGYLPLRTGIVNDDRYLKAWVQMNPLVQPNLDQLMVLQPRVSIPGANYRQIVDLMLKAADSVVYQGADAATTLKQAQDRGQQLMPKS